MNWFEKLKDAALGFVKTPFAQQLAFGQTPAANAKTVTPAPPAKSATPAWLLPVGIIGGVVVLLLVVLAIWKR